MGVLTISQQPQLYTSAYNDQFITIISTDYATTGFKYLVEVSVNGSLVNTYSILPRPDGYLVFNAMECVKNYIEHAFDPTNVAFIKAVGKSAEVSITITETGVSPFDSETITYTAFDACLKSSVFRDYDFQDYISGQTFDISFLSPEQYEMNYPDSRVTLNTDIWLYFYRGGCDSIEFRIYDIDATTLLDTVIITVTGAADNIFYINAGPQQLMANGSVPILDGYYIAYDFLDGVTTLLEANYTVHEICTKHEPYIVYYLKRNGQMGYFHFELLSQENVDKKTNNVRMNTNRLSSGVYGNNVWDREKTTVNTETTNKILLNSNWITASQSVQLEELWDSPLQWLKTPEGDYLAIDIIDNSYKISKHENEKLFNYTINCEFSQTETRQRGI